MQQDVINRNEGILKRYTLLSRALSGFKWPRDLGRLSPDSDLDTSA